ncbi:choice-of-anchor Q domain-containing protein [Candidatus Omnitrophota bacterium]
MIAHTVKEMTLRGGRLLVFALIIVTLVYWLLPPGSVHAATYTVTTTADAGAGSLRQAILDANATVGVRDTINFLPSLGPGSTIVLAGSDLVIDDDLDIVGPDGYEMIVSGNNNSRVFTINSGKDVSITGLNIRDGLAPFGGGIQNLGTLELHYCIVEYNHVIGPEAEYGGYGGGIENNGDLLVDHCIIRWNTTSDGESVGGWGAGISNGLFSTANITYSAIHDNLCGDGVEDGSRGGNGGGIHIFESSMTLTNCTISGNEAGDGLFRGGNGGGIFLVYGSCTINNCTITNNSAGWGGSVHGEGGGIFDDQGGTSTYARNCIIADNHTESGSSEDIGTWDERLHSQGCNIIGDISGWIYEPGTDTTGDQLGVSPMLDALADNGGFTPTHALQSGSPAIDGVLTGYCFTYGNIEPSEPVTDDQRDSPRPQDGDGNGQALCDIGAFEYIPTTITCPADVTIECDESSDPSNAGSATATDNCGTPTITYADVNNLTDCNGTGYYR